MGGWRGSGRVEGQWECGEAVRVWRGSGGRYM